MSRIFLTCPFCDSNLDPGEKCDCVDVAIRKRNLLFSDIDCDSNGQFKFRMEDMKYERDFAAK